MIGISSQMREFVNFAQDAVANNAKNSIARLGGQESRFSAFSISAAVDGDSVGKLRRSIASKNANNTVRAKFHDAIAQMFGGADKIPENVLAVMNMKDYKKGKPLTADRILDVYAAIKDHIEGLKLAAFRNGTIKAAEVADSVADRFVVKFKAACKTPPGAAVAANLKQALLLCTANVLDDDAVKGGEEAVRKFVRALNASFKPVCKAFGFDVSKGKANLPLVESFMKDGLHMRSAVFALLDKDGNVDAANFGKRFAMFDDAWMKRCGPTVLRAEIDPPGPEALDRLRKQFVLTAKQRVGDAARDEVEAYFKADPGKIPAALRNDRRASIDYVGLVKKYVVSRGVDEVATRQIYGDATATHDVAAALRDFNAFMDSIYALAEGDKDILGLVERFAGDIAFNGEGELRSLASIKKKYIEPIQDNLRELRAAAGGNAAILKVGVDALVQSEMKPFKKGVFAKLANGAKAMDTAGLDSLSERSTPIEIGKAFTDMYAKFKKSMPVADYNDPFSRAERNAYTLFFAGVAMSKLDGEAKARMVAVFATQAAETASNIMQTLVTGGADLSQNEVTDLQDAVQMMRKCSTFIADDFSIDADSFAVNIVDEEMTADSIPDDVAAGFAGLVKGMQE